MAALPSDFATWTLGNATTAVQQAIDAVLDAQAFADNRTYVEERNHWGDGRFWLGPNGGTDMTIRTRVMTAVERQFVPVDVTNEVNDRQANSLLRKEADVSFAALEPAPEDSQEAEAQAAEADAMLDAVSALWDRVKLWRKARLAEIRSRWSGRGSLRWAIVPGQLDTSTEGQLVLPTGLSYADAFKKLYLNAPAPDECALYTDPATQTKAAVFIFADDKDQKRAELWYVEPETGDTVARILGSDDPPFPLPLGGRLPIAEMEADLLITESVRRQQARLNFIESSIVRLVETAAFAERYTINASPEGEWSTTLPTTVTETRVTAAGVTEYLHPRARTLGAAITTELRGFEYDTDDNGGKGVTTPGVVFKEPTNPEYLIRAAAHCRKTILEQCKQGHVLANSEAIASGYSREQARADYEDDLANTKAPLEGMLRDIIESAIALAEAMGTGGASFLERYRCVVNLHVDSGPMSPEEKSQNITAVEKRMLSRRSAMALNGVEDVAAEDEAIEQDPQSKLDLAKRTGEALAPLVAAQLPLSVAAGLVGLDEDVVTELERVAGVGFPEDEDEPTSPTNGNGGAPTRIVVA